MTTDCDFGAWRVEASLEKYMNRSREGSKGNPTLRSSANPQRPASATVRVPYLPSHVRIYQLRGKRRPRSAASSYMRSTFAIDSALPAGAEGSTTQQQQRRLRWLRRRQPKTRSDDAKYVLDGNVGFEASSVPRPLQGFGVRTAAGWENHVVANGGGGGGMTRGSQQGRMESCRSPYRRPASAPVRFFGGRSAFLPGYKQTPAPESRSRHGSGGLPPRQMIFRSGLSLTRRASHQHSENDTSLSRSRDGRKGPLLPTAAWGVRPASAASAAAARGGGRYAAGVGGWRQTRWTYEEVVVCRSNQRVIKGSAARQQRLRESMSPLAAKKERHRGIGLDGRGKKSSGHFESPSSGSRARDRGGTGGSRGVGRQGLLDLSVRSSPWGAFVGGPPLETTAVRKVRNRPSSAPRHPRDPSLEHELGNDRFQTRPRSAHAASSSQYFAAEAFVTRGCSVDNERNSKRISPTSAATRAGDALTTSVSQSSCSLPAANKAKLAEGIGGVTAGQPSQADGARVSTRRSQQWAGVADAAVVEVARQVQSSTTILSPPNKEHDLKTVPKFCPRAAGGELLDVLSPPLLAPPMPPTPPPPLMSSASEQRVLGLFGSSLQPAAKNSSKEPLRNRQHTRHALRPRPQQAPMRSTLVVETTTSGAERRNTASSGQGVGITRHSHSSSFTPAVLDQGTFGLGEQNGRRFARTAGLVGKALRVQRQTRVRSRRQQARSPSLVKDKRGPLSGLLRSQNLRPRAQ